MISGQCAYDKTLTSINDGGRRRGSRRIILSNQYGECVTNAPQVVTVGGTIPQKSSDDNDKAGDTSPQNDLMVTKLDMVRDTCTP
jgi:hypothetical protein